MTTIGSIPYAPGTRYAVADSQESARKTSTKDVVADSISPPVDGDDQLGLSLVVEGMDDDDTDTFLYNQTGKLAEPPPTVPSDASRRFANFDEEYQFRWHATEDELTEVYGTEVTQRYMRDRELVQQGIAVFQQTLANAKRDNPEFVANTYKSHATETVSMIEDNLKQLNMFREMRDDPEQLNFLRENAASWVTRFLGAIQDYSETVRSIVDVSGNLIRQQDDGTYVLSDFTLSYEGVQFFQRKE